MRLLAHITLVALWTVGCTGSAWAQTRSMFSGGTTGGTLSAGTRTFSAGATTSTTDTAGQITGNERFLRQNKRAGNFIGADSTDAAYAARNFSIYGSTGTARQQQFNRGTLRSAIAAALQSAAQASTVPPFQTGVSTAFARPELSARQVSESLSRHMEGVKSIPAARSIHIAVQGDTAILRGQVASDRDRALLEQLARLEPGIWKVKNELTVAPPKATSTPAPAGARK